MGKRGIIRMGLVNGLRLDLTLTLIGSPNTSKPPPYLPPTNFITKSPADSGRYNHQGSKKYYKQDSSYKGRFWCLTSHSTAATPKRPARKVSGANMTVMTVNTMSILEERRALSASSTSLRVWIMS